jgi:uncharacterized pyridoxamine 5'-phosphate oxidase family protein
MNTENYSKILVEDIHSTIVATVGEDGRPVTRAIDMMLWDKDGVYFLTAKGKAFYAQLMEQKFIALSAVKDKKAISLRGTVQNIGNNKLDEIFEKNAYMQKIYPGDTRSALEVFQLCDAEGDYFDISDPEHVFRDRIVIAKAVEQKKTYGGYYITDACTGCGICKEACPQKCINISAVPAVINQNHCLHCGQCFSVCPENAVMNR